FIGAGKNCQIQFPNMLHKEAYQLLTVSSGAQVHLSGTVSGVLFQGQDKSTRTSHVLKGSQNVTLKPYEMVRLDFNSYLKLYVRLMGKPAEPPLVGLLNLRFSEALALFFAVLLTALLFFYGTLYAPSFLAEDTQFIEKDVRVAQVIFNKKPEKRQVVKYDLTKKTVKAVSSKKRKVRKPVKKAALKTPIKKRVKKISTPKKGKQGKMAAVAPGKKRPAKPKIKVGSARPGGSIKTGKAGSSAKTVAPDPTKVGIVGLFGSGGKLKDLDKGASGPGGITGLANQYTGASGTEDAYEGEGLGTRTKELSSGGKGTAIQGISGIKTKGKGLGIAGTGSGGLGERGRMSMEFSAEDIDVTGEIDREAILRVIRRNQAKFQRCYQVSLNEKASVQGNLTMKWMISAKGKGQNARSVESEIDSGTLKNCVGNVLERLIFPEPPSGQIPDVQFTFRFYL
ncbi:MAG: AgmX/PglI C-terminal domain-containing protein, partial [Oligoflexia bacterium]|nr:AgmX/PglI C-terminal domain-containing protein [Oligoflexia bacterium]